MTESPTNRPRASVRIAPATYDDIPGIATCELLAFSAPPHSTFDRLLYPFHPALSRTGAHPRHWPTYISIIRERGRNLRDGSILFVAHGKDDRDAEMVVGVARMTPPREMLENARKRRKWNERVLGDVVYPAVEKIRDTLWKDHDGMDLTFLRAFKKEQSASRERVDKERHYYLNTLAVHPSYQGKGVGSALLDRCCSLADAEGVPMMLQSSEKGHPLYTSRGFVPVDSVNLTYNGEHVHMPCMVRHPVAPPPPPKPDMSEDREGRSDVQVAKEDEE